MRNYAILLILLFTISNSFAQFEIDGQLRMRGQLLHGYKKPVAKEVDPAFHIGQRTRLNLKYKNDKISTLLSIQDVRVWGDANIVNPTGVKGKSFNTIDVYEAWVQFKLGENSILKLGRQEMKYDDQRHISWRNWWDRGQTYDAILYSYKNKASGFQLDLSSSYNSIKQDLTGNNYSEGTAYFGNVNPIQTQTFIYLKKKFNNFYVSLTGIGAGYQKEDTPNVIYMTYTEGLHLNYNATKKSKDGLFGKFNAFIQNGKNITGKKINANMLTAQLGYRLLEKRLELSAGIEMLSGNDAYETDADYWKTDHTYNLLYGARHPYYEGYLDWFVIPKSAFNAGIQTLSFNLNYKLDKSNILKFAFNHVAVNNNVKKMVDGNTLKVDKGTALVQTLDFTYIKSFNKIISLMSGISYAMPSDEFLGLKNVTDPGKNYFIYTMLTVKPKLFSSKK